MKTQHYPAYLVPYQKLPVMLASVTLIYSLVDQVLSKHVCKLHPKSTHKIINENFAKKLQNFFLAFLKEGVFETSDQGYYFEMGALYNPNTIGDNGLKGSGKLSFHVCEDQIADPPVTTNGEIDVFCFEPGNDVPILEFSVSINTGADRFEAETNYDESILVPGGMK